MATAIADLSESRLYERIRSVRPAFQETSAAARAQPNLADRLKQASAFLLARRAASPHEATHLVVNGCTDWWMTSPGQVINLAVAEDNTLAQLYEYIAWFHELGIPLTLAEKRTETFRFVLEIDILGTEHEAFPASALINHQSSFARLLGQCVGECYQEFLRSKSQHQRFLEVLVYNSTGFSQTSRCQKTSIRLVWPELITGTVEACRVRDLLQLRFEESQDQEIRDLAQSLRDRNVSNTWSAMFTERLYGRRDSGILMPLCDWVSPLPLPMAENRPFSPMMVLRFSYRDSQPRFAVDLEQRNVATAGADWVRYGSTRVDEGVQPTQSTWPDASIRRPDVRPAIVKRTRRGSDELGGPAWQVRPVRTVRGR